MNKNLECQQCKNIGVICGLKCLLKIRKLFGQQILKSPLSWYCNNDVFEFL